MTVALTDRLALRRTLTQDDFDRFAALSGDDNPIHVDPAYAARTRFGRTVSHGILLLTVLRGVAETLAPGFRLGRHEVRFPAPTFAAEPMVFQVWRTEGGLGLAATREEEAAVTCDGLLLPLREKVAADRPDEGSENLSGVSSDASAETTRAFSAQHVQEYASLGGETPAAGLVPEPLISALFSYLLGVKLPGPGANYLKQETDFAAAARVGEALTARVQVTRLRPEKSLVDLRTTCRGEGGRTIAAGRALIFIGDVA